MKKEKKKMSKLVKAIVGVAAAGVIVFTGFCVNEIAGNPVSKHLAAKTAEEYLAKTYPDLNLETEECHYDFKSMCYRIIVTSPDSVDTEFFLEFDSKGNLTDDDYDWRLPVNTIGRFNSAVSDDLEPLLIKEFGKECEPMITLIYDEETQGADVVSLDEPVDLDNFPFKIDIYVEVYTDDRTDTKLQEIVDRIDKVVDGKYVVNEYSVNFWPDTSGENAEDRPNLVNVSASYLA